MGSGGGGGSNVVNVIVWRHFHFHAKALMLMAVILQLLGSGRCSYRTPPEGAEEGLYMGFVDENGEKQLKYLGIGDVNTTLASAMASAVVNSHSRSGSRSHEEGIDVGGPGRKLLQQASHVACRGDRMRSVADVVYATSCLAQYFGQGNEFENVIVYNKNGADAYGCDYRAVGPQFATEDTILEDAELVNVGCAGWGWSGYFLHAEVQASYGRTPSDTRIC